jgi:hypothetical protein
MTLTHDISIPALETFLIQAEPGNAHSEIATLHNKWTNEPRKALSRLDCQNEGNCGQATQSDKEKIGVLFLFLDGRSG